MTKVVTVRPFRTTSQTPFEVPSETPFRPEPEGDVVKKYRLRDGVNFWIFNIFVFVRNGGKDDSVRSVLVLGQDQTPQLGRGQHQPRLYGRGRGDRPVCQHGQQGLLRSGGWNSEGSDQRLLIEI